MIYKIAADSSANLSAFNGVAFANVPLKIVTAQREFTDGPELDLPEMLSYLEDYKGRSGTSCPNVGDWLDAFGDADRVFALTITSNLSGCYNAAAQAKAEYEEAHPDRRVCTLDSLSTGPEMVLIAEKLRELIAMDLDFDEIETEIRSYMTHTHLLFSLESLNNLARNGRVSPLVAKAAGLLGIRVVGKASDHGTLEPMHKCRGAKKALAAIVSDMKALGYSGGKVRVAHCQGAENAEALKALVAADFPDSDIQLHPCAGLCSFYAERGGLLVGFEDGL